MNRGRVHRLQGWLSCSGFKAAELEHRIDPVTGAISREIAGYGAECYGWFLLWLSLWLVPAQAELITPPTHELTVIDAPALAPALRLPDMKGEIVDISTFKGRVVVVNFWATWCPPCVREMPSLEHLYQATRDRGVVVLAVNIGEDVDTISSFLGSLEPLPTFPVLIDSDSRSLSSWGVRGLPTTFVVSPDGQMAYQAVGGREFNHPQLIDQLMGLIKESVSH